MNKTLRFLILTIIASAIFLRCYKFTQIPAGTYWDETAMIVDAKAFVSTGLDQHGLSVWTAILPSYGDYKLPVYPWCVFLLAKIIGANVWAIRLPSLLAGLASIGLAFILGQKLARISGGTKNAAIFGWSSALIVATSPWAFVFSRAGFEANLAQLWLGLAVWLMINSSRSYLKLLGAIGLGILAQYTYYAMGFVWPIVLAFSYLLTQFKTQLNFDHIKAQLPRLIVVLLLIGGSAYLAQLTFNHHRFYNQLTQYRLSTDSILNTTDYAISSNQLRQWAGNHVYDRFFFHRYLLLALALVKNIGQQLSPVTLFFQADNNLRHSVGHTGQFLWLGLIFLLIGGLSLLKKSKNILMLLIVWVTIAVIPASVPLDVPHSLRSLGALMPLSLLIGWGLALTLIYPANKRRILSLVKVMVLSIYLIIFLIFGYTYFVSYKVISADVWQSGYGEMVKQVYILKKPDEKVLVLYPDELLFIWFMAYGPYSGQEFKNWPSRDFKRDSFDQIFFKSSLVTKNEYTELQLLVGDQNMVESFINLNFEPKQWICRPVNNLGTSENIICQKQP